MLRAIKKHIAVFRPKISHQIALGFLALILIGAFLLCLPISHTNRQWGQYFPSLFSAVGSVCVTGLSGIPVDNYSAFGQAVVLVLFQMGGLGFMTITTLVMMVMRKKITLKNRIALQNALNTDTPKGVVRLVKNILILTFSIEFVGFLLLVVPFCTKNGARGVWLALFHACSAFSNTGILLKDAVINNYTTAVSALLIALGGLGFIVIVDIINSKGRYKKLSLHSKIVLPMTAALLAVGALSFFAFEYNNVLKNYTLSKKIIVSLFESANCRTAGFHILDHNALSGGTKLIRDILIFIGGSPGSMSGGIKTTTAAVLIMTVISSLKNKSYVTILKHNVHQRTILKSVTIFGLGIISVALLMLVLLLTESGNTALINAGGSDIANIFHISLSTLGTASGYFADFIALFSAAGRCALMAAMLVGRLGLVTTGLLFTSDRQEPIIKYPDGNIILG